MTDYKGFPLRALENIIAKPIRPDHAVEICTALAKELIKSRAMYKGLYLAAAEFSDCYVPGKLGPSQMPPGSEANLKLEHLQQALKVILESQL